jgi:uncharacterized protein
MRDGYRIIDSDCHVIEPDAIWASCLAPQDRHRAPQYVPDPARESPIERVDQYGWRGLEVSALKFVVDGVDAYRACSPVVQAEAERVTRRRFQELEGGASTPESQRIALERLGVDVAFCYPTVALHVLAIDGLAPALSVAFAESYNTWLRGFCRERSEMLQGVGVVSRYDPEAMVEEVIRIAGFGWRAVTVRPNVVGGRRLADPAYEPFWRACEEHEIAVGVHEGAHARVPTAGADRFSTRFGLHSCSHPLEQMLAFVDLLEGGVFERHPRLHVAFLEAGAGWVPYWLWRLDEAYERLAWEVRSHVRELPSTYFRRQCFVSIEPTEPGLELVVETVGPDCLLFGSDYPHMDCDVEVTGKTVALASRLGADVVRRILWDNPCRFYRWRP